LRIGQDEVREEFLDLSRENETLPEPSAETSGYSLEHATFLLSLIEAKAKINIFFL
jgi:hypothetical protein